MKIGNVNLTRTLNTALIFCGLGIASASQAVCDPSLSVVNIDIKAMKFWPAETEICLGQTVRWTNSEPSDVPHPIRHTVTFDPALSHVVDNVTLPAGVEPFESGFLVPGAIFEKTFDVVGEYKYICRPHELMGHVGKLTVVDPEAIIAPNEDVQ